MKILSELYIDFLCAKLERIIGKSIKRKRSNKVLRLLKALSFIRYKFHLGYKNEFIENQIKNLSQYIVKAKFIENNNEKSIVIIDEINVDYIGLMIQYLDPFILEGYQILYLFEHKEHHEATRTHLMQTLNSYENAQIKEIPSNKRGLFSKAQWIYDEICAFGSKKVLMNLGEWAVEKCIACYALPIECIKYHINAGDHCFWAGVSCVDYSFEFRHYGANLTYHERGLNQDQIIYLPFYPVLKEVSFKGFPDLCSGKFVFLSGGAAYKIVDENNTFFGLCRKILDECSNAVILYAGANAGNIDNDVLSSGIDQFGLHGKFISIGYRDDILEVFKHSDVYLDTYPIGGGTMCQFAAQCSLPIVNYNNPDIEECVSQKNECSFTYYSESDFIQEAVKLYSDAEYRNGRGSEINDAVVSKSEFDTALLSFMSAKKRLFKVKWNDDFVPRTFNTEDAINYNNKALFVFYYQLFHLLGRDSISLMPGDFISFGIFGIKRKIIKIFKNRH